MTRKRRGLSMTSILVLALVGTITAIVLNLPSMGRIMYDALIDQDMYLAGSWLFLMAIVTVIGTFISDVLLAWLDPRARKEYLKG